MSLTKDDLQAIAGLFAPIEARMEAVRLRDGLTALNNGSTVLNSDSTVLNSGSTVLNSGSTSWKVTQQL